MIFVVCDLVESRVASQADAENWCRSFRFFTESLHSFYGVEGCYFHRNSQNLTENSQKIHDPRCLHCVLCAMRAGGIRPSLSSSFEVQAGNAQVLTVLAAAAAAAQ